MAAPVPESLSTATAGSGTEITGNKPTGTVEGDWLIACLAESSNAAATNPVEPSGWGEIVVERQSPATGTRGFLALYKRKAGSSEPSTYTFTTDANAASLTLTIVRVSGGDSTDIEDVVATAFTNTSSTTSFASPSVTTTVNDCLILRCVAWRAGVTLTEPSGHTEVWDYNDGGQNTQGGASATQASAGSTGSATWTASSGQRVISATLALKPASGGGTDVTPNDATHAHSAESPTITQVHEIAPADASHAHSAESPTLTQAHVVAPDDATHAHASDAPAITQVHEIAPADATHGHTAESPDVNEGVLITPDAATHAHAAESPALTQVHAIAPDDGLHGHASDSPTITQVHVLVPADCLHGHTAESPAITQVHEIAPNDATHGHTVESPTITVVVLVSVNDATHAHTAESPTITQVHVLAPADCLHAHAADSPTVSLPEAAGAYLRGNVRVFPRLQGQISCKMRLSGRISLNN